ncbi:MAG: hypothetical protein HY731_08130 [Candidatus Tectomicrobia bacterium]|nr:hypothetical protein [Candidatus Tectomicrobia bacterium]
MTFWLDQKDRADLEVPFLEYYYSNLLTYGVQNYSWDDCWHDYRVAAIRTLLVVIVFWINGIQPDKVWGSLDRAFIAFDELGCADLLK